LVLGFPWAACNTAPPAAALVGAKVHVRVRVHKSQFDRIAIR
jgi:hypothetical protein